MMSNVKSFDILMINLSILQNYFDGLTNLLLDSAKFLDISARPSFRIIR